VYNGRDSGETLTGISFADCRKCSLTTERVL